MASSQSLSHSIVHGSDEPIDHHCFICAKYGKEVEATQTCFDCRHMLCSKCVADHVKFDAMKGHRIIDKVVTVTAGAALPSQMCEHHYGKIVDMLCRQHDRVCCTACIAISHSQCDGIEYIPSISTGTKICSELQKIVHNAKFTVAALQETKTKRETDMTRIKEEERQAVQVVHDYVNQIIDVIKDIEKNSLIKIQSQFSDFQQRIDADIKQLGNSITTLEKDLTDLQSSTCNNESELFVTMKQSKEHEKIGSDLKTEKGYDLRREAFYFNIDRDLLIYLKHTDMLGHLEKTFSSSSVHSSFNARANADKEICCITGICEMPFGDILLTDSANRKLKRMTSAYTLIDYCCLDGAPESICRTGPVEVAVTLPTKQMVQFVSVSRSMTPTRSFRVNKECHGIAYNQGQLFVLCGITPGEVRVYSIEGVILSTFPEHSSDQSILEQPREICLTPDGRKILVIDWDRGIVTMDRDGKNVNSHGLRGSTMCAQDQSLWFVYDGDESINQINSDGSDLGCLIKDHGFNYMMPSALFFQKKTNRLLVGFYLENYIEMYKVDW